MALTPATISPAHGATHGIRRLGRGHGSTKGKSAGRGTKGQRARSGGKARNKVRGFRPSLLKIPKSRGFKSMYPKAVTVSLVAVDRVAGKDVITPRFLAKAGLTAGHEALIKIVGTAELKNKLTVVGCLVTKGALAAIEKAGGTVKV